MAPDAHESAASIPPPKRQSMAANCQKKTANQ
jgi:hypothetical protein